jgi:hypothetical protein
MRFTVIFLAVIAAGCGDDSSGMDGGAVDMIVPHDLVPQQDQAPPVCDVLAQTGCSAGQHCTVGKINGTPQNLCFMNAANPLAEGAACMPVSPDSVTVGDTCAAGLACVNEIGDVRCRKLCLAHEDCGANQACVALTGSNQTGTVLGVTDVAVNACVDDSGCDPIMQTGCPTGTRCVITRSDFVARVTVCGQNVTGQGKPGDECASSLDCAAGVRCSGLGFCRQLCYPLVSGNPPVGQGGCPSGFMCTPISAADSKYGECD